MLTPSYGGTDAVQPLQIYVVDNTVHDPTDNANTNDAATSLTELAALHARLLVNLDQISTGSGGPSSDTYGDPTLVIRRPWVEFPDGASGFDEGNVVNNPAIEVGAVVVSHTVPDGNDGVVNAFSWNFLGGGFNNGSGDLVVQIRRNGTPIRNYNNILVEKGSTQEPRKISPIRTYAKDVIDIFVTHVDNIALNGQVAGSLVGWDYPSKG